MSKPTDIDRMNFQELRAEVQSLRDKLARMERYMEDALFHIDTDNLSESFVKRNREIEDTGKQNKSILDAVIEKTDEGYAMTDKVVKFPGLSQVGGSLNIGDPNDTAEDKKVVFQYIDGRFPSGIVATQDRFGNGCGAISVQGTEIYLGCSANFLYIVDPSTGALVTLENYIDSKIT